MVELLLEMNDDCVEHVLKRCDPDSIVAVSQTCKKLKSIATRLFKNHTKYDGEIASREDEARVKRTIASIGNNLVKLNVNIVEEYESLDSIFFDRLPQKCQHLEILRFTSFISPIVVLGSAQKLHQLQHLSICHPRIWFLQHVDELALIGLTRQLAQLQSLEIGGFFRREETIVNFLIEARNLKRFRCYVDASASEISFEADHDFLETFRSSENPAAALNRRIAEIYEDEFRYVSDGYESPSDIDDDYGDEED